MDNSDREAKTRATKGGRASMPGAQAVNGEEAARLDERITEKKRRSKRSSRQSEEGQPGAHAQLNDLEDRIAAKSRTGRTTSTTSASKPGASAQLNDLEDRISAKSRASRSNAENPAAAKPGASAQLNDLEDKISAKSRGDGRRRKASTTRDANSQLDDLEARVAAKTRGEPRKSSKNRAELDDLEDRIANKTGRTKKPKDSDKSLGSDDKTSTTEGSSKTNPAQDGRLAKEVEKSFVADFMDSFAYGDEGLNKFDGYKGSFPAEEGVSTAADQGIVGDTDMEYGQYGGGYDGAGLAVAVAVEDDEEDAFIPAAIEYDPDAKPPIYKNRRFRLYAVMSCILVTVAAVAVAVGVTSNMPDNGPTSAPIPYRETIGIQEQLISVVGEENLNKPKSAYDKAADWIMNVDPMQLTIESPNLIQRYLLALFYFSSTEEGPWLSCNPPKKGENTTCTFQELAGIYPELTYGSKEWIRWLSDENECAWAGVFCDENNYTRAIELSGQEMTGTLPAELSELIYLQSVTIDWNSFHGTLPVEWASNKHLLNLELHYNFLTGTIPDEWWSAQALQRLNLAGNLLTGSISTEIGRLGALKGYFSQENMMTGTIPTEFGSLKFLAYTRISRNFHDGTIPTVLGNLDKLQEFWIHRNQLTGTIPTELGDMKDILDMRLHFNPLTGTIPEEIYNLETLNRLDLYDCQLTGTISPSIAKMTNLEVFRVRANRGLTGTIPSELGALPNLNELWFHITGLVGTMPAEICAIRGPGDLEYLEANCAPTNGVDPPGVECDCCTECCDAGSEVCDVVA